MFKKKSLSTVININGDNNLVKRRSQMVFDSFAATGRCQAPSLLPLTRPESWLRTFAHMHKNMEKYI